MTMITVQDLTIGFGDDPDENRVLHDVGFEIVRGEVFGLVGESGSGKSTVLRCIAGLYSRWSGSIAVDGNQIQRRLDKKHYRKIQMVFQDPYGSLHPKHTIDRTLAAPLRIHGIKDAETRIPRVLEQVGLPASFRYRYPHQLSGGQRQRVAIARALVLEPEILLLDEPTSALDVSIQAEILNLLSDIRKASSLTYIMVSHDLAVVGHLCDRIAVMQQGKIEEILTYQQLLTNTTEREYSRVLIDASRDYDRTMARNVARGAKP